GMRELRCELGFAEEALPEPGRVGEVLCEHLDGDRSFELAVAREIDRRHTAPAQHVLDPVATVGESLDAQSPTPVVVEREVVVPSVVVVSSFLSWCLPFPLL